MYSIEKSSQFKLNTESSCFPSLLGSWLRGCTGSASQKSLLGCYFLKLKGVTFVLKSEKNKHSKAHGQNSLLQSRRWAWVAMPLCGIMPRFYGKMTKLHKMRIIKKCWTIVWNGGLWTDSQENSITSHAPRPSQHFPYVTSNGLIFSISRVICHVIHKAAHWWLSSWFVWWIPWCVCLQLMSLTKTFQLPPATTRK